MAVQHIVSFSKNCFPVYCRLFRSLLKDTSDLYTMKLQDTFPERSGTSESHISHTMDRMWRICGLDSLAWPRPTGLFLREALEMFCARDAYVCVKIS
ncbi:hypothetical protein TNCV_1416541 [Trichonephila clavipes]|nr:hypothetical protein TNCV_1416541 [Trichonephila clavipes]